MYSLLRPLLFQLDPEKAHHLTLNTMVFLGKFTPLQVMIQNIVRTPNQPIQLMGLTFPNRVGLAAGYDKDATAWRGLAALGFGHIEVGTITLRPQAGNPKPRVFRLVDDQAIINRMGFPGMGAEFALRHLQKKRPKGLILGINLGMNKTTPLADAHTDYEELMTLFHPYADYLTINISSPNTVGLRELQGQVYINQLLSRLKEKAIQLDKKHDRKVPLVLKLSPDLTAEDLTGVLTSIQQNEINGIIATNTTIKRPNLQSKNADESGGLSGAPLTTPSTRQVESIRAQMGSNFPIIAVGGIMTAKDAEAKIKAGADLVQIYSGLIYRGPRLVKECVSALNT